VRLIEPIYFASLKTEEGKPLQIRVALVDPANADPDSPPMPRPDRRNITRLGRQLSLTVANLTKLSKAADPWSSCLAAYFNSDGQPFVWGLIDQTVHFNVQLVRETTAGGYATPGLFQVLAAGAADLSVYREFGFVARLQQDQLLTGQNDVFLKGPVQQLLAPGFKLYLREASRVLARIKTPRYLEEGELPELAEIWERGLSENWTSVLCRLLISIQRYRHGGALLITRSNAHLDVKYRISYSRLPQALAWHAAFNVFQKAAHARISYSYLNKDKKFMPIDLYLDQMIGDACVEDCEDEITGCVRFISALSCVDGLILAGPDLAIRGFGVEIRTGKEPAAVYVSSGPTASEKQLRRIDPTHYGTRHRTMMRFCFAHPGSVGFVISQDGEIRAMTYVRNRLVMWENLKVLQYWEFRPKKKKEVAPASPAVP